MWKPSEETNWNPFFIKIDLHHITLNIFFQSGTGLVSLEEFRTMVNRKQEMTGEQGEAIKVE